MHLQSAGAVHLIKVNAKGWIGIDLNQIGVQILSEKGEA